MPNIWDSNFKMMGTILFASSFLWQHFSHCTGYAALIGWSQTINLEAVTTIAALLIKITKSISNMILQSQLEYRITKLRRSTNNGRMMSGRSNIEWYDNYTSPHICHSYWKLLVPGLLLSILEPLWHNGQKLLDLEPDTWLFWYIICAVHSVYKGHHTGHQWEYIRIPAWCSVEDHSRNVLIC